ncbi:MAG TPA: hypothetical protein ENJ18_07700 [Nannocystis exedens]|nr:hypothetical protein [Nannocystis exedens]
MTLCLSVPVPPPIMGMGHQQQPIVTLSRGPAGRRQRIFDLRRSPLIFALFWARALFSAVAARSAPIRCELRVSL